MKKFLSTKINKQQWRITVPNINSFKKNSQKDDEKSEKSEKGSKRSSGFYDFQEAQLEYDKHRSLPSSVYVDSTSSDSGEDIFEDARAMSDRSSNKNKNSDSDMEFYTDIETPIKLESANIDKNNSKYEYDVPRISFKFFDKNKETDDTLDDDHPHYEPVKVVKSEVKIVLFKPEEPDKTEEDKQEKEEDEEEEVFEPVGVEETIEKEPVCHPSEKFVSQTEMFVNSLESIPLSSIKSAGSDPNIALRVQEDEDGFYKIPRSLKKQHRLSQSLKDFDVEKLDAPTITSSDHSSIEHISASQVLVRSYSEPPKEEPKPAKEKTGKLPQIRRPSLLKNPKKAVDKWNNFRTKFNNIMTEQASHQKVGAFQGKEKPALNLEEMYKNSKSKCKKVLQNTSKMFHKKKSESFDDASSEPVRTLKASDIEYKLNYSANSENFANNLNNSLISSSTCVGEVERNEAEKDSGDNKPVCDNHRLSVEDLRKDDFDFSSIRSALKKKLFHNEGQNGFEDLRRYVKQGGDFCKELSAILQERSEAETQYAKNLSKLSAKLLRSCREGVGGLNEAWKSVAIEMETRAEGHRLLGIALQEETAKPLRTLNESQHRLRKQSESAVDKAGRLLADWRTTEAKGKKHSHTCARDNEKLQDAAVLDTSKFGKQTISKSSSLIHLSHMKQNSTDKENAKLEGKKRKAEDAVKKADVEYYSLCVRAERARLEWESAVLRGASTFQALEEERLTNLKTVLASYLHHSNDLGPRLIEATERLKGPVNQAEPTKDLLTFQNLRQSSQQISEQLLPDFYCEHITLAMNRERRKQALVKLLQLIWDDIERERKSKHGLQNLSKAIKQNPSFGSEDSQQTVTEKLFHMNSMLTYLEAAKYKIQNALAELDSRPRTVHSLAPHITITRDKSGLQQSILKVPQWLRDEWCDSDKSPLSEKSIKSGGSDNSDPHINDVEDHDWLDRGAADGNSNQPDSDFDEFSSQCSSTGVPACSEDPPMQPIATCKALYAYTPNMADELPLRPGEILSVYRQQEDGWWLGESNGSVGIFPATYVEIIKD